jgi:hypothetical protein
MVVNGKYLRYFIFTAMKREFVVFWAVAPAQ